MDSAAGGTGDATTTGTVTVACDAGYSGSATMTCTADAGAVTSSWDTTVSCTANACTTSEVPNSDHAAIGSVAAVTGQSHYVTCNTYYETLPSDMSGGGTGSVGADVLCMAVTGSEFPQWFIAYDDGGMPTKVADMYPGTTDLQFGARVCQDIDECATSNGGCDSFEECWNGIGSAQQCTVEDEESIDEFLEEADNRCTDADGNVHDHGEEYAGFGDNYCRRCHCYFGDEVCDDTECADEFVGEGNVPQLCASTTCKYGVRFTGFPDDMTVDVNEIFTADEADDMFVEQGHAELAAAAWASDSSVTHEFTTAVFHHTLDENGSKFNCGNAFSTTNAKFMDNELDECKCYCTDDASASLQIYHDAPRHAEEIADDMLSNAGCECQSACANDHDSDMIGDAEVEDALASLSGLRADLLQGQKLHNWCFVEETCVPSGASIKAAAGWDYCSDFRAMHLTIATP
jgi:hypothetical protein